MILFVLCLYATLIEGFDKVIWKNYVNFVELA